MKIRLGGGSDESTPRDHELRCRIIVHDAPKSAIDWSLERKSQGQALLSLFSFSCHKAMASTDE